MLYLVDFIPAYDNDVLKVGETGNTSFTHQG